jgi:chromate transport protein ChrA
VPRFGGVLYGIKPVVIAIVVQALWNLARTAIKTKPSPCPRWLQRSQPAWVWKS